MSFPDSDACTVLAQALDRWARDQGEVRESLGGLPRMDRFMGGLPVGLYVDDRRAPWLETAGELRFSLARVYSVTPAGVRLVGQIQVTAEVGPDSAPPEPGVATARARVRIHYYLHELDAPGTRELDSHREFVDAVSATHAGYAREAAPRDAFDPSYI